MKNQSLDKLLIIFLSLWCWLVFIFETAVFVSTLNSNIISIPFPSAMGIVAWLGLIMKKRWGIFWLEGYFVFTGLFTILDILETKNLHSIIGLALLIIISIPLLRYLNKNDGILNWR